VNLCLFLSSRRRHTTSKRDWSSDVCSSDLKGPKIMTTNTVTQWARNNPFNQLRYSLSPVALPGDVDYIPEPEIVYDDYGNVVTVQHDIVYFSHPGQLPDSTFREQLAYKIQSSYPYRAMSRFANGVQTVPFAAMMFVGVLAYLLHVFFGRFIMPRRMESLFD